jgi:DNA-binding response OmpR family regulator
MTRVLIVDDDITVRNTMVELLVLFDFEVKPVSSGAEAIAAASRTEFDVVVMDINMEKMNGLETYRALRKAGVTTPVVVLTGWPSSPEAKELRNESGVSLLVKPPEIDELVERIRSAHANG